MTAPNQDNQGITPPPLRDLGNLTPPSSNLSNEIEDTLRQFRQHLLHGLMSDTPLSMNFEQATAALTTLFNKQIVEAKLKLIDEWLGRTERFPNGYYGVSTVELAHKQAELKKELE